MDNKYGLTKEEVANFDSYAIRFIQAAVQVEKEKGLKASIDTIEMAHTEMANSLVKSRPSISNEDATAYTQERFTEIANKVAAGAKISITKNATGETRTESVVKKNIRYTRVIITLAIVAGIYYLLTK